MSKKMTHQFNCSKMMLPEHHSTLQKHEADIRSREKYRRPSLDEQRQEELQYLFEAALLQGRQLKITVLKENGYQTYSGLPRPGQGNPGFLNLRSMGGKQKNIRLTEIVDIKLLD